MNKSPLPAPLETPSPLPGCPYECVRLGLGLRVHDAGRLLLLALATAVLAIACSPMPHWGVPLDSTISISTELSAEDAELVVAAAEAWHRAAPEVAFTVRVSDDPSDINLGPGLAGGHAGLTHLDHQSAQVQINREWLMSAPALAREAVIMHELGHALGLTHAHAGLMTPTVDPLPVVDADTLAQFRAVRATVDL